MLMKISLIIRSFLFYAGYVVIVVVWSSLCLVAGPFLNLRQRALLIVRGPHMVVKWFHFICNVQLELEGQENIPLSNAIVLSKHQSTWETFFLASLFRPQAIVMKKSLLRIPFFGWALAMVKPIAIDRSKRHGALKMVLEQGKERLEQGYWLTLYPEGTRVDPGNKRNYSNGAGMLAAKSGFPIVPVALNAGLHWPAHRFIKYPGTITVRIGKPIITQGKSAREITREVEEWIEFNSDELMSRPQAGMTFLTRHAEA
jgi:1-acyl-sn-glycerol-3-phosphate acyltransferase